MKQDLPNPTRDFFNRMEFEIEIDGAEYKIGFRGKIQRGLIMLLLEQGKKIPGFDKIDFWRANKITIPRELRGTLLNELSGAVKKVKEQVRADTGKDWEIFSQNVAKAELTRIAHDIYSFTIIIVGDCSND